MVFHNFQLYPMLRIISSARRSCTFDSRSAQRRHYVAKGITHKCNTNETIYIYISKFQEHQSNSHLFFSAFIRQQKRLNSGGSSQTWTRRSKRFHGCTPRRLALAMTPAHCDVTCAPSVHYCMSAMKEIIYATAWTFRLLQKKKQNSPNQRDSFQGSARLPSLCVSSCSNANREQTENK